MLKLLTYKFWVRSKHFLFLEWHCCASERHCHALAGLTIQVSLQLCLENSFGFPQTFQCSSWVSLALMCSQSRNLFWASNHQLVEVSLIWNFWRGFWCHMGLDWNLGINPRVPQRKYFYWLTSMPIWSLIRSFSISLSQGVIWCLSIQLSRVFSAHQLSTPDMSV